MSAPRFSHVWISDLHLDRIDSPKNQLFQRICHWLSKHAENIYILGDLWDAWLGDDSLLQPEWQSGYGVCTQALATLAQHRPVFFMVGNRDFVTRSAFHQASQLLPIDDPYLLTLDINGRSRKLLMTHGDRLCLSDTVYMKSLSVLRSPAYINDFLSKPMSERINQLHAYTRNSYQVDVDINETHRWMLQHQAQTMIHGHIHQPGYHPASPQPHRFWDRWVLHNWDKRPGMLAFDQKCLKLYDFIEADKMITPFSENA